MKEYDLFLPLYYNDGSAIDPTKYQQIQDRLIETFGGLTVFPQPNQGYWQMAGVTYRDEIIIFRVVTANARVAHRVFRQLKAELKEDLQQEEILIIVRDVDTL